MSSTGHVTNTITAPGINTSKQLFWGDVPIGKIPNILQSQLFIHQKRRQNIY